MSDIKWIKLSINVFDDEKFDAIKTLPDSNDIQLAWIKLLCLAGKCNESGFLMLTREIPYTDEMLASRFGMDIGIVQRALAIFQKLEMVDVIDNVYMVSNWTKYQSLDAYEKKKEYDREYRQKKREEQKALLDEKVKKSYDSRTTNRKKSYEFVLNLNSNNLTSVSDIDTVNTIDTTENTNKDNTKHKVFIVPTVEEVTEYCKDKSLIYVNPEAFIDFYESKNWMIGKNKMSSWKSAVSGWNRRSMERGEKPYKPKKATSPKPKPISRPKPEDDGRLPMEEYMKINPNI